MVYIDIRYTPQEGQNGDKMKDDILDFFRTLASEKQTFLEQHMREKVKYVIAKEDTNKYGEKTHLHYHINMELPSENPLIKPYKKDTIAKQLNRKFALKGNKMYSLRVLLTCENTERWWRYPCKQGIPCLYSDHFTKEEIERMNMIGAGEYEQRVHENQQTRDKLMNKNNFRTKLAKHLHEKCDNIIKKGHKHLITDKQLWLSIAKYYIENHTTPPFQKMDDLVIDMKVELKIISLEEYYDMKHQ